MDNPNEIQEPSVENKSKLAKFIPAAVILIIAGAAVFYFKLPAGQQPETTATPTASQFLGTGSATLSWNANTEPDLAGYRIYYGTEPRNADCPPGGYPEKVEVAPDKPNYRLENLANGKTYYFSISSYDASGNESCFSQEMSKEIK